MKILYVSFLYGRKWTGPNYSVPNQILAQSEYDDVFWYNINNLYNKDDAPEDIECFTLSDFPNLNILELPSPFHTPDLVIFEDFYHFGFYKLAKQCIKRGIPYIIIPRSALTNSGQRSKKIKKTIANMLFFKTFAKKAIAIQYLTQKEHLDSGDKWNSNSIIIPNGITINKSKTKEYNSNSYNGIFIGRLDIYQKGLDILIEACALIKTELYNENITINIHGPDRNGSRKKLEGLITDNGLKDIVYLKKPLFDDEKVERISGSDFFILTSRFEGHPMGLIEALSYRLPCLVTIGSNMGDEILQHNAGWVAKNDNNSIANQLLKLIEDKRKFKEKSENAFELSKLYDWEKIAKTSHEEYTKLLS